MHPSILKLEYTRPVAKEGVWGLTPRPSPRKASTQNLGLHLAVLADFNHY